MVSIKTTAMHDHTNIPLPSETPNKLSTPPLPSEMPIPGTDYRCPFLPHRGEEKVPKEELGDDAAHRPEIRRVEPAQPQDHLGSSVLPGVHYGSVRVVLVGRSAEVDDWSSTKRRRKKKYKDGKRKQKRRKKKRYAVRYEKCCVMRSVVLSCQMI